MMFDGEGGSFPSSGILPELGFGVGWKISWKTFQLGLFLVLVVVDFG